jgi:hypothetical protein
MHANPAAGAENLLGWRVGCRIATRSFYKKPRHHVRISYPSQLGPYSISSESARCATAHPPQEHVCVLRHGLFRPPVSLIGDIP